MRMLLGCAVVGAIASCGQKGPLYLPDKAGQVVTKPKSEQTKAAPAPAPQPNTTSSPNEAKDPDQNEPR